MIPILLAGYLWAGIGGDDQALAARFTPPAGHQRVDVAAGSFGAWLRGLPLRPGRSVVRLFDGRRKSSQDVHLAVVDIDVGAKDLQQCADAVMRLRAEYLFSAGRKDDVSFHFTSGDLARFDQWAAGQRPRVDGARVRWSRVRPPDSSYASFRTFMDTVFQYAGSKSLADELVPAPVRDLRPGDVFIQGGFPGHAVIVVDVAVRPDGARAFLLAQSYMPAQDIHVLKNPATGEAWFTATAGQPLDTPEWTFPPDSLRRFREPDR